MNDEKALRAIGRGDEDALAWVIDRYAAYVSAVVFNILGTAMQTEDLEETVSDVFLALWANSGKVKPGKLKAYLGGIARNKAKEKLRSACMEISLEDDLLVYNGAGPEPELEAREEAGFGPPRPACHAAAGQGDIPAPLLLLPTGIPHS